MRMGSSHGTIRSVDIVRSETFKAKRGSYSFATAVVKWDAALDKTAYPDSPVFFIRELWNKRQEYGWVIFPPAETAAAALPPDDIIEEHRQKRIEAELKYMDLTT